MSELISKENTQKSNRAGKSYEVNLGFFSLFTLRKIFAKTTCFKTYVLKKNWSVLIAFTRNQSSLLCHRSIFKMGVYGLAGLEVDWLENDIFSHEPVPLFGCNNNLTVDRSYYSTPCIRLLWPCREGSSQL